MCQNVKRDFQVGLWIFWEGEPLQFLIFLLFSSRFWMTSSKARYRTLDSILRVVYAGIYFQLRGFPVV